VLEGIFYDIDKSLEYQCGSVTGMFTSSTLISIPVCVGPMHIYPNWGYILVRTKWPPKKALYVRSQCGRILQNSLPCTILAADNLSLSGPRSSDIRPQASGPRAEPPRLFFLDCHKLSQHHDIFIHSYEYMVSTYRLPSIAATSHRVTTDRQVHIRNADENSPNRS
jgi:hypothetical protein